MDAISGKLNTIRVYLYTSMLSTWLSLLLCRASSVAPVEVLALMWANREGLLSPRLCDDAVDLAHACRSQRIFSWFSLLVVHATTCSSLALSWSAFTFVRHFPLNWSTWWVCETEGAMGEDNIQNTGLSSKHRETCWDTTQQTHIKMHSEEICMVTEAAKRGHIRTA